MPFPSRFWADLATTDFAALDPVHTVAVLPVAATEQHGPHLPLSVDQALADGVVAAALPHLPADLPALFLPTQAVGYSPEHTAFAGTLTLSPPPSLRCGPSWAKAWRAPASKSWCCSIPTVARSA
jgi:creatinine amidohydrolase